MKVEVENQPHCVATLKIELPPEQVSKEWDAIANSFAAQARIPGYRPGKAPKRVIEAKFRKDIQDELTKKLVSKSYHEAIAEKQLRVVSLTNLEDVEFGVRGLHVVVNDDGMRQLSGLLLVRFASHDVVAGELILRTLQFVV